MRLYSPAQDDLQSSQYYLSETGHAINMRLAGGANPPAEWMVGRNFRPKICDA